MTVKLNLKPSLDAQLRELAKASRLTIEEYLSKLIEESVPIVRSQAAVALLDSWKQEDASADRDELKKRRDEWAVFKANLNEGRTSDRILFP